VVRAGNPCHSRALVAGAGVLLPLVGWDGLAQCGAFGLVLGINDGVCPAVEADYRAPVRVGAWWSAARCGRERERTRMGYEPDWNEPSFYSDEDEACEVCTESPCLCEKEDDDE
jgi:hypothetical protein